MLNRATITYSVKYLFDNIGDFSCEEFYEFLKSANLELPDDVQKVVEEMYYEILLNNKEISIDEQINIVSGYYHDFKEYISKNNIKDKVIDVKLSLMDIEIPILTKFICSREHVRKIRRGYK